MVRTLIGNGVERFGSGPGDHPGSCAFRWPMNWLTQLVLASASLAGDGFGDLQSTIFKEDTTGLDPRATRTRGCLNGAHPCSQGRMVTGLSGKIRIQILLFPPRLT